MATGKESRPPTSEIGVRTNSDVAPIDFITYNEEWSDNPLAHRRASGEEGLEMTVEEGGANGAGSADRNGFSSESLTPGAIFKLVLLFTGVTKPSKWCSAWWLCWVGWRLMLICLLTSWIVFFILLPLEVSDVFILGMIIAYIPAALNWYWLPALWSEVVGMGALELTANEAKAPLRLSLLFIGTWLLFTTFICSVIAPSVAAHGMQTVPIVILAATYASNVAPCGAFLLVLSVDVTLAQIKVKRLVAAARDQKLTRGMYVECSDYVNERCSRWAKLLGIVAITAAFSMVTLLLRVGQVSGGNVDPALQRLREANDINAFGKQATLFFFLLFAVFGLNDDADSIISELVAQPWGAFGSAEEGARLDLLHLATTYAVKAEGLSSPAAFFTAKKTRPISFRVCGARVTRAYFLAALTSFTVALINVLVRALYKPP